jgi:hypothetical protein
VRLGYWDIYRDAGQDGGSDGRNLNV